MADVPVSALDERQRRLVENARVALERGNFDYAIDACAQVLKAARGCVAVRRLQRVAQLRKAGTENRWMAKARSGLSAAPFLLNRAGRTPAQAWTEAEKRLTVDPTSRAALKMLGDAAMALGEPETAVFAFEACRELNPDDQADLLALGRAWLAAGRTNEAVRCAQQALKARPADAAAHELVRRAAVAQSVVDGKWETAGTFRENLKANANPSPRGADVTGR